MEEQELRKKILTMSEYLDDEAIAKVLKLTPEMVDDIRNGRAEIRKIERSQIHGEPVLQVGSVKASHRQKIISVCRAKGGVGTTVFAVCLAYMLSREVKTLLVDLNLSPGGSDVAYYLGLSEYPHMGIDNRDFANCITNVEPLFDVLKPPRNMQQGLPDIDVLMQWIKQEYDAAVIDLPNGIAGDKQATIAVRHSNTIIAITSGLESELARLSAVLSLFSRKSLVVVANNCKLPVEAEDILGNVKIVHIEYDDSLMAAFRNCDMPSVKSPFMRGVSKIKDALFERERRGLLKILFG